MFFPKSIGLSIHGNDLFVSKASQVFIKPNIEYAVMKDFLVREQTANLRLILDAQGFQARNIILSWPREKTIVREIELPGSNISELRETISYQLDSFVMFTEDEIYYEIYQSNSDEYGEKVFIFAIKKEDLDSVISRLESSNLKPDRVIVSPLSFIPLLNDNKVAIIERCEGRYTFNLYLQSTLVSTSLAKNKDILKGRINENMPDDVIFFGLEQDEVSDIFETDAFNVVYWNEKKQPLGVSLNGLSERLGKFNILKSKVRSKVLEFSLMGVLALLALTFIVILPGIFRHKRELSLQAINLKLEELRPEVLVSNRLRERVNEVLEVSDKINEVINQKSRRIDFIAALTNTIPEDTWVRRLYIKDNSFEMEGVGLSGSKVLTLLEYSPQFDQVSFTSSIVKDKDGKEKFKIKGDLK